MVVYNTLLVQGLIMEASRSHLDTPQSVGLLLTRDQPDAETSDNITLRAPGGIRTRDPSTRAAADPRLRPGGHRDRLASSSVTGGWY